MGFSRKTWSPERRDDTLNLEIAGLLLRLNGPASLFPKEFSAFASEKSELPDQEIDLVTLPPSSKANGTVLLRNPELTVMEAADRYVFLFPTMKNIREASMTKDGSYVRISCAPTSTEENLANLFHAIRLFFLFLAQKRGRLALHSASLLYQGKAWLFSGHSGMGKSTHTNLWHELFQTPLLNGDLNLLGQKDGRFLVYGLPWCGTSEIFTTETQKLGGIVLLGRDPEKDFIQELSAGEKTVRVMQRLISPCWSEEQLSENLAFSEALAENLPVLSFLCTKNPSAARTDEGRDRPHRRTSPMKDKLLLIQKHLKQGTLRKMWAQSKWILQYGRRYWKSMVLYTLLGIAGSGVSLISSLISKDLVDIITGHQTGKLLATFAAMIGFSLANILVSQASGYASTFINLKVDSEIKNDIFAKMLVTDWESLTAYHTGDLVTRWSSDASNISSGILNWIPNLIIYTFRFVSALAVVLYYDPTFALFALLGIPFSALLSRPLLRRMRNNNQKSAAMNAKMYGFNQEAFSNIQTIKAFDLIRFYTDRLKSLQTEYIRMRLDFQKMSILTSVLMSIIGFIVSYSCYGWGIYRVWSNAISYGTMTMFLSLSGTLTSSVNSLTSLIPTAISLTISAGRLMDIVEMPQEDYSQDSADGKTWKTAPARGHWPHHEGSRLHLPHRHQRLFRRFHGSLSP